MNIDLTAAQIDVPALNAKIEALSEVPLGPARERRYAALDRSFTKLAPWVSYGNYTVATIVSKAVDLDGVFVQSESARLRVRPRNGPPILLPVRLR